MLQYLNMIFLLLFMLLNTCIVIEYLHLFFDLYMQIPALFSQAVELWNR